MSYLTLNDNVVKGAIHSFVTQKKAFSAWDVVQFLRGKNYYASRADVNGIVHNTMASNADYDKTDNGKYIYYVPKNIAPQSNVDQKSVVSQFPKSGITHIAPAINMHITTLGTVSISANENRINLPSKIMNILGGAGMAYEVLFKPDKIVVRKPPIMPLGRLIKTDHHNNLRIRLGALAPKKTIGLPVVENNNTGDIEILL